LNEAKATGLVHTCSSPVDADNNKANMLSSRFSTHCPFSEKNGNQQPSARSKDVRMKGGRGWVPRPRDRRVRDGGAYDWGAGD